MTRWLVTTRTGFRGAEKTAVPTDISRDHAERRVVLFADTGHTVQRGVSLDCAAIRLSGRR